MRPTSPKSCKRARGRATTVKGGSRPNNEPYPYTGSIIFVNRQITAGTGTIQLAAAFPNKNALLRPGGFGQVRIKTKNNPNALLVPQPAVIEVQTDYQVAVLNPEGESGFPSG